MQVQATQNFRSPITQGGLEIKSLVRAEWPTVENMKFLAFKNYVQDAYKFEESLNKDDSKEILQNIMKIEDGQESEEDGEDMAEAPPILMEEEE